MAVWVERQEDAIDVGSLVLSRFRLEGLGQHSRLDEHPLPLGRREHGDPLEVRRVVEIQKKSGKGQLQRPIARPRIGGAG